ncbi:UDP-2,3-diacylglucosamine hydrolase [Aliarcobacter faecis]|uniref:UDP-2,3-diacylglucosamine diphosphatase n=1 Tax=Aliarcobacter faecis TaxID=1564138 RepID=UPI00047B173A|nr:metallophosphoesterase [Aliarcobacter faecis]QKF73753.1 UDP-2,3-diacylglucosamine hydrolase [Aliarcobacter faecis]
MSLILKENAIFIADSHYNEKNQEFKTILEGLEKKEINASQIFLMGDNFDFLSCECKYFIKQNIEVINLLNKLSTNLEIVYLEGNHDFNLQKLFPNIKVLKRENQPFFVEIEEKKVALSHGDNFLDWKYELFCKIIRNSSFLKFMNFIDINFFISKKLEKALLSKNICHNILDFEKIVEKRLDNYESNIVIEGHYHQGNRYAFKNKEYINVPSLCCQKSYTVFKNGLFLNKDI